MDIYPTDLDEWTALEVRRERTQAPAQPTAGLAPNTIGSLTLGSLTLMALSWVLHILIIAIFMGVAAVVCLGWFLYLAISALGDAEILKKPLSAYELQTVRHRAEDKLLQSYLDLAHLVVVLPATKDETANREVRDAISALATAVEALPPEKAVVTDNPPALRAEAQVQIEAAQRESDSVIAASLRRRAESLLRRADTATRTLLLLRRNRALRDEVGEQIEALRTSLTALQVGGHQSAPELSGLAASIHRVALEANAVTVAREEVDTLLSQPRLNVNAEEPQVTRLLI